MTIGMTVMLLLAGADLADDACELSCTDLPEQGAVLQEEPQSFGTECGTVTLQFKVGGEVREKQQQLCEIRVRQR
ncbi:MAG: hypothetical protein AAGE37_04960 [Pseudomonadota bacterium]